MLRDWDELFRSLPHPAFPAFEVVPFRLAMPEPQPQPKIARPSSRLIVGQKIARPTPQPKVVRPTRTEAKAHAKSVIRAIKAPPPKPIVAKDPFGGFVDASTWPLRKAVAEAHKLGAEFYIIGADSEVDGDLPGGLRAALPADQLYEHLGAAAADREAIEFLARLEVTPVLITDATAADFAMSDLDGASIKGLDVETGPPNVRPKPIRITATGTVAVTQPPPDKAGLDPHRSQIMTAQLYGGGARAYVFHGAALRHLLESDWFPRQRYVAHNSTFEYKFAKAAGIELDLECTMQAFGLCYGVENHYRKGHTRSLANASRIVLGLEPPKEWQTSCWSAPRLSAGQVAYAASDPILAYRLWQKLKVQLRRKRLWAYDLQRNAAPVAASMELQGIGYTHERHARLIAEWQDEADVLEQQIVVLTGKPPPAKGNETQEWIKEVAGPLLPTWLLTPTGKLSTTAADLARLEDVPAAQLVLKLRAVETLLSSFGDKIVALVNPKTGRIHGNFNVGAAKTGRCSSSEPNMQNQPGYDTSANYKDIFTAAPGYQVVSADLKQVELRTMAHVSDCPDMRIVFVTGGDIHVETACAQLTLAGIPRETLSDAEFAIWRERAKSINFSVIYGTTGKGFAKNAWKKSRIHMTEEEGDAEIAQFFARFPRVKEWMNESYAAALSLGMMRIGVGRIVEAVWEEEGEFTRQQAANLPIQSLANDLMLFGMRLAFDRLRAAKINGALIAVVHDELIGEFADSDVPEACYILQEALTEAFLTILPGAPTTGGVVDLSVGPSWGELSSVDMQPAT